MIITGMAHFQSVAKKKLVEWYHKNKPEVEIDLSNVFVVWSCKTLQNYKCLASTTISGFKYIYMLIFIQHISAILQIHYTLISFIFQLFSNFLPAVSLFSLLVYQSTSIPYFPAFLHFSLKIHLVKKQPK